jgi:5-oxopent-3-ene-1,2,5-tricarboxylate decarboxylase/2-hydroxyhepta-2,4-diene-1,7-dioate isomerase
VRTIAHGTVIGVALNHRRQLARMEALLHEPPYGVPPRTPVLFIKPENTLNDHGGLVPVPAGAAFIQPGPSLAVVIGSMARRVDRKSAMDFVKGYTLFNDFSLPEADYFRPPIRTKCFDGSGVLGSVLVSRVELPDPDDVTLRLSVNGELRQEFSTGDLVRGTAELLAAISSFLTLRENDVIATGFPPERIDVRAGDRVTIAADDIGSLENRVVGEQDFPAAHGDRGR